MFVERGLELNIEYDLIKINKENFIKYHWKWNEKMFTPREVKAYLDS